MPPAYRYRHEFSIYDAPMDYVIGGVVVVLLAGLWISAISAIVSAARLPEYAWKLAGRSWDDLRDRHDRWVRRLVLLVDHSSTGA
jgi:hypothetical protein